MPTVTLIDNYDSFTFNLAHYLGALGADVSVWRNDEISVADVLSGEPDAIVLSPGPATPDTAGICLDPLLTVFKDCPQRTSNPSTRHRLRGPEPAPLEPIFRNICRSLWPGCSSN